MRITAVVVTFNRLDLLKRCISSLKSQTHKLDEIIIINNSSTDGTLEWLNSQEYITVITQTNSGGAGGFYTGLKYAHDKGFEWIWCMDDDTLPLSDTLEQLLNTSDAFANLSVISPIPISNINSEELSFLTIDDSAYSYQPLNLRDLLDSREIETQNTIIMNKAFYFVGVLIRRTVLDKIGYPIKKLFMWGDESEFDLRVHKAGFDSCTDLKAKVIHPQNKWCPHSKLFGVYIFNGDFNFSAYCYFRNQAFIAKMYYAGFNLRFLISHVIFYLFLNPDLKKVVFIVKAFFDGLINNFSRVTINNFNLKYHIDK